MELQRSDVSAHCVGAVATPSDRSGMDVTASPHGDWSTSVDASSVKTPPTPAQLPNLNKKSTTKASAKSKRHDIPFVPERNIVISVKKSSSIHENFSHDIVRRSICKSYGPVIIEKVNRYRYNSDNPRIMLQLESPQAVLSLIDRWDNGTFGGSSVRCTIDPKSLNENVAMLRGVPLDAIDEEVCALLSEHYPGCSAQRLRKGGKSLRVFKVKFCDKDQFTAALSQRGFQIDSDNVICHFSPYVDG